MIILNKIYNIQRSEMSAKSVIAKLEGVIEKLKGLSEDTKIRQYRVSSTGDTEQVTCDYRVVSGNEEENIYHNVDTYLKDDDLAQIQDEIEIMYVVE
jgi:hypothetical protein